MPVSSEEVLAFIKDKSELKVTRNRDGEPEFTDRALDGPDLAAAIESLFKVIEAETAFEFQQRHLDAHVQAHNRPMMSGGKLPTDGGSGGNYH